MGRAEEWALEIKKDEHENQAGWKHLKNATVKEALSLIETAEDRDIAKFLDFTKSEIKTMVKNFNIKEDDLLIPLFISISQDYLSPKLDQIEKKFFDLIKQGLNEQEISKKLCVSTAKVIVVVKIIIARILLGLFDYYRPYKSVESYEFLDSAGSVNTLAIEGYEDVFVIHSGHNFLEINTKGKVLTKIEGNYYCRVTKNSSVVTDIKGKCGLIDNQGNYIIKPEYISLEPILPCEDNKYFIAARPDKYGIINKYGKVKIDFKYDDQLGFLNENLLITEKNSRTGIIDINENVIVPFEYRNFSYDVRTNTICASKVIDDKIKYGLINLKNEVLIDFKFNDLYYLCNGYLFAKDDFSWMCIDQKGNPIKIECDCNVC